MTAAEVLQEAARLGVLVSLHPDGDRLIVETRGRNDLDVIGVITALKSEKAKILALLRGEEPAKPPGGHHLEADWRIRLHSAAMALGWSPMTLWGWESYLAGASDETRQQVLEAAEIRAQAVDPEARARRLRDDWTRHLVQLARLRYPPERVEAATAWAQEAPIEEIARVCIQLEGWGG